MNDHFDFPTAVEVPKIEGRDRLAWITWVFSNGERRDHESMHHSRSNISLRVEKESCVDTVQGVGSVLRPCSWLNTAKIVDEDRSR